jgi:hypothetical protein
MPRGSTADQLGAQVGDHGQTNRAVHGERTVADLVHGALVDAEPGAADALLELERVTADHADFRAIATQLHVLAVRPAVA